MDKKEQEVLVLPECLVMATVCEIRQLFLARTGPEEMTIDARGVTNIDLTGMQLLIAILGSGAESRRPRLSAISTPVEQALARAGITLPAMH